MRIYVDNKAMYSTGGSSVDVHLSLGAGVHNLVAQAWDTSGAVINKAQILTVK